MSVCFHLVLFLMQIFQELEKIGTSVQEDVVDAGPIHGDMQGDISKCPYHSAKMGNDLTAIFTFKNTYLSK